jgi:hypothetical protein
MDRSGFRRQISGVRACPPMQCGGFIRQCSVAGFYASRGFSFILCYIRPQVFYFVRKINIKLISQVSHPLFLTTPKNTTHYAISSIDKSIELVNI